MRRKLAAGNWKMNGTRASLAEIAALGRAHENSPVDILICPPATLLSAAAGQSAVQIGAQDCHMQPAGAHTGDISAPQIRDAGASAVILGHSERRQDHGETNAMVRAKAEAAAAAGLMQVICLGESAAERAAQTTLKVIAEQLDGSLPDSPPAQDSALVLAYEPIWAIGTGHVPQLEQIAEVHGFLRARLKARLGAETGGAIRLLYGGSVKPDNAAALFSVADVDGALVGGASLTAADFSPIITALAQA
ncbi:triose-phosphate isomerase [uncultured Lentibacter sp.]|jgi:triosephosphate isomerase|uniref:triose-phosphate isomerase n=1 Tax=uncultured Lentibacter sp. TaxID=1659309 RepID=UPI0026349511|nr:triose-phosphate isomerase [uncultured Lentibacter sp.]